MRHLLAVLALTTFVTPYLLGIIPGEQYLFAAVMLVFFAYIASLFFRPPEFRTVARMTLSVGTVLVLVVSADLLLRPLVDNMTFYRPHERFVKLHDKYSRVCRYRPTIDFTGTTCGDLAAMSGRRSLREPRAIRFHTDPYGFCNDVSAASDTPFSLLVMGDSFGVGTGASQDYTWASLLRTQYGHRSYNLSQIGNHYDHLLNFQIEEPRLHLSTHAVCLLVIFTGNDLDEPCDPQLSVHELRVNSEWDTFMQKWQSFKNRSAIRRLLAMNHSKAAPAGSEGVVCFKGAPEIAFYRPYVKAASRSVDDVRKHPHFASFMTTLAAFNTLVARRGCTFAVASIPTKAGVYPWIVRDEPMEATAYAPSGTEKILEEYCSSNQIPYCDLGLPLSMKARELWRMEPRELVWWRDDTHLNNTGHAVVAACLDSFLRAQQTSPPERCRER